MSSQVPIRKIEGRSKPWMLDLRGSGGGRKFFDTEALAIAARKKAVREVTQIGRAAMGLTEDEKLVLVRAKMDLAQRGATIEQAIRFFIEHHAASESVQFEDAIRQFIDTKRAANKDSDYLRIMESDLRSLLAAAGDMTVHQVKREQIEAWLFGVKDGGKTWQPATIASKRINVRTFFKFAEARHWLIRNPAQALERVQMHDKAPGILTVDQCAVLLETCRVKNPTILPHVVLNLFCGIRPEEVAIMGPDALLPGGVQVEVAGRIAKSRKRRLVDISENAQAWLAACEPMRIVGVRGYSARLQMVRGYCRNLVSGEAFPWPRDCLRHSFGSYHLALHGSADRTATQMGHSSTAILFRHYRELVTRSEAERFWSLRPQKG